MFNLEASQQLADCSFVSFTSKIDLYSVCFTDLFGTDANECCNSVDLILEMEHLFHLGLPTAGSSVNIKCVSSFEEYLALFLIEFSVITLGIGVWDFSFGIWATWGYGFYLHMYGLAIDVVVVATIGRRVFFVVVVVGITRLCNCGDLCHESRSFFQVVFEFFGVPGVVGRRCSVFFRFFLLPMGA